MLLRVLLGINSVSSRDCGINQTESLAAVVVDIIIGGQWCSRSELMLNHRKRGLR